MNLNERDILEIDEYKPNLTVDRWLRKVYRKYCQNDCLFEPFNYRGSFFTVLMGVAGKWVRSNKKKLFDSIGVWHEKQNGELGIVEMKNPIDKWQEMRAKRIFSGMRVLAVGGIEGLVLADLGADATNIDPRLENVKFSDLPFNVTNIAEAFPLEDNEKELAGKFDITFSFWLLDRGSGLNPIYTISLIPPSKNEIKIYTQVLSSMLRLTKPGGWSLHNGNMIHHAMDEIGDLVDQVEIISMGSEEPYLASYSIWIFKVKS